MSALLKRAWELVLSTAERLDDALCSTPEARDERARQDYERRGAKRRTTAAASAEGHDDNVAGAAASTSATTPSTTPVLANPSERTLSAANVTVLE